VAKEYKNLENQVYIVPREIDSEVGRLKLVAMGIEIDELTAEQEKYLNSWNVGT
jgi:adenosylhomocysteinase